jgi:hypothetical protein
MDTYARQFELRQGTSAYWHNKSHDLLVSAQTLWVAMQENRNLEVNCCATYKMLLGMSFELVLKAHCVGRKTDFSKNHKLVDLASNVGISITDEEKSILNILTEYIIWDGRYPTPKQPQHLRDHWKNQNDLFTEKVQLGSLKGGKSNGKLDFENLRPIWRRFSDAYLAAYS